MRRNENRNPYIGASDRAAKRRQALDAATNTPAARQWRANAATVAAQVNAESAERFPAIAAANVAAFVAWRADRESELWGAVRDACGHPYGLRDLGRGCGFQCDACGFLAPAPAK